MSTKNEFIQSLFFACAWRDTVGHNQLYRKNTEEDKKKEIKNKIKTLLEEEIIPKYKEEYITPEKHLEIMGDFFEKLQNIDKDVLNPRPSHAQKLLNMILKYYWCGNLMGGWKTREPPLCPIDSIILKMLSLKSDEKSKLESTSWTTMNLEDYRKVYTFMKSRDAWKNPSEKELKAWDENSHSLNEPPSV